MSLLPNLLNAIPVDIVEMIIVSSRDYKLFEQIQEILIKLQELTRVSRINDKLTECKNLLYHQYQCEYLLNNYNHREYDKPSVIFSSGELRFDMNGKVHRKNDYPSGIDVDASRYWRKYGKEHRENDLPREISINGSQLWMINGICFRENNKPYQINCHGIRFHCTTTKYIFDYLNT